MEERALQKETLEGKERSLTMQRELLAKELEQAQDQLEQLSAMSCKGEIEGFQEAIAKNGEQQAEIRSRIEERKNLTERLLNQKQGLDEQIKEMKISLDAVNEELRQGEQKHLAETQLLSKAEGQVKEVVAEEAKLEVE